MQAIHDCEALDALRAKLTPDDPSAIESEVAKGAAAGERYDEARMAVLDKRSSARR
jgi:hypothetical protein